eukprot:6204901-Pleurochrysis_carterae.AAC.8
MMRKLHENSTEEKLNQGGRNDSEPIKTWDCAGLANAVGGYTLKHARTHAATFARSLPRA